MRDIIALEAGDGGVDILGPNAESNAFGGPDRSENGGGGDNNNQSDNTDANSNTNNLENISAPTSTGSGGSQNDNADSDNGSDSTGDGSDNNPNDDNGGEDDDNDYSDDSSEENNEDETRIKQNTIERMKHLYEVVSSNLDKLTNLNHEIKNINIMLYSKVQNRFVQLKEILFKLISEDAYLNKDCADYVRYYITAKEMYNLCIQYTQEFFDNYEHLRKMEKDKKGNK